MLILALVFAVALQVILVAVSLRSPSLKAHILLIGQLLEDC